MRTNRQHYRKDGIPKRSYMSQKDAKKAAKKWHTTYLCGECRLWHLASKRNRRKETPRRRDRTALRGVREESARC